MHNLCIQNSDKTSHSLHFMKAVGLFDEWSAIRTTGDKDEKKIDQFALGLHDRLVRRDVKRFVAQNRTNGLICRMEVLEAATDAAREHALEENNI